MKIKIINIILIITLCLILLLFFIQNKPSVKTEAENHSKLNENNKNQELIHNNSINSLIKTDEENVSKLKAIIKKLEPIHKLPSKPKASDWLSSHTEYGQTFDEYLKSRPIRPTDKRNKIYVIPLGNFDKRAGEIIEDSATFMKMYFQTPVVLMKAESIKKAPDSAKRINQYTGQEQLLSTWVLNEFLKPQLPDDALAMIAFTSIDLWPGEGWNFVFGQASLRSRVGVWSIARNGDPNIDDKSYQLCLLRTLKTATHETGHMLSIEHCIAWECNMAGANTLEESDRHPLYLCPECVAKICWATKCDMTKRYKELLNFCQKHKLEETADYYQNAINLLNKN